MDTLHRNFNLFHHQVPPASTWSNWRTASLHHTWREDTSPNSQLQLIKDRSQPCSIQYCEQLKVTWSSWYAWELEFLASWLGSVLAPLLWSLQQDRPAGDYMFFQIQYFSFISKSQLINIFDKKNIIKAFLGLDNAGKTSLVQLLSTGVVRQVFATPIDNNNFPNDNSGMYNYTYIYAQ